MISVQLNPFACQIGVTEVVLEMPEAPEAVESNNALESLITGAIAAASNHQQLDLAFAILSPKDPHTLHAEEEKVQSTRTCEKKKVQFRLGRAAARLAFRDLDYEHSAPILQGTAGEPLWPDGFTGSITHCDPWTVAVVAASSNHLAIGIDLESVRRVQVIDISDIICCDAELRWVRGGSDFYTRLATIFSAKEALYKAVYPFCRRYIDFKEVEFSCPVDGLFYAEFVTCSAEGLFPQGLVVHSRQQGDLVFSFVIAELNKN